MSHQAFAFDWNAFELNFGRILLTALKTDSGAELAEFIQQERVWLTDPYNGDPLPENWRALLETGDVQELADFALTRYYSVRDDHGVGGSWLALHDSLTEGQSQALLGAPFGHRDRLFDPGRLGSYFQSPVMACESLAALAGLAVEEVGPFRELLTACVARRLGVYVTF